MDEDRNTIMTTVVFVIVAVVIGIAGLIIFNVSKNLMDRPEVKKDDDKIKTELISYCAHIDTKGSYKDKDGGCVEFTCYYNYEGDAYLYDCTDVNSKVVKESKKDIQMKSNLMLSTACSMIDVNGNLESDYGYSCEEFVCEVDMYGKSYSKDCRE